MLKCCLNCKNYIHEYYNEKNQIWEESENCKCAILSTTDDCILDSDERMWKHLNITENERVKAHKIAEAIPCDYGGSTADFVIYWPNYFGCSFFIKKEEKDGKNL